MLSSVACQCWYIVVVNILLLLIFECQIAMRNQMRWIGQLRKVMTGVGTRLMGALKRIVLLFIICQVTSSVVYSGVTGVNSAYSQISSVNWY